MSVQQQLHLHRQHDLEFLAEVANHVFSKDTGKIPTTKRAVDFARYPRVIIFGRVVEEDFVVYWYYLVKTFKRSTNRAKIRPSGRGSAKVIFRRVVLLRLLRLAATVFLLGPLTRQQKNSSSSNAIDAPCRTIFVSLVKAAEPLANKKKKRTGSRYSESQPVQGYSSSLHLLFRCLFCQVAAEGFS